MSLTQYECTLCTENMADNDRIICPHCSIEICEPCFQYSITMELQDPVCIYCKKSLSIEFILSNNATQWCEKVFLEYYSNLLLEKEKNKLMDTLPRFKIYVEIDKLKKERNNLFTNKKIMNYLKKQGLSKDKLENAYENEIFQRNLKKEYFYNEIEKLEMSLNIKKEKKEKISYITKCPNTNCKGFINTKYFCEICDTKICNACFMITDQSHICSRHDIESADMIKKDSKPCPGCYVPIFKISGCNQMFCTNCKTVFHWETLQIDKGPVHNQHYFDYLSGLKKSSEQTRLDNAACGTIEEIYTNFNTKMNLGWLEQSYRKTQEINTITIPELREKFKDNFEKYRIEYLYGNISEKSWKQKIMKDTIHNEAYYSYIEIFEMFVTVSSDLIRKICFDIDEIIIKKEKESKNIIIDFMRKNDESMDNIFELEKHLALHNILIDEFDIKILLNHHLKSKIKNYWKNIDLTKPNILDEIYVGLQINIYDLREIFEMDYINLQNHLKKCLNTTYQTFGIEIRKKILLDFY